MCCSLLNSELLSLRLLLVIQDSKHSVSSQKWSRKVAIRTAESDWTDDVARFSGDAGINAWYAKVRNTHSFSSLACCGDVSWLSVLVLCREHHALSVSVSAFEPPAFFH